MLRSVSMTLLVVVTGEAVITECNVGRVARRLYQGERSARRINFRFVLKDVRCHSPKLLSRLVDELRAFFQAYSEAVVDLSIEMLEELHPRGIHRLGDLLVEL